jgi:predicted KAP-like P-loop ATPase
MEPEPAFPHFSADQPLTDPAEDKLNRSRFSAEIARAISNWSGRESLVVGLTGEWGAGKSTIKNFVISHLKDNAHVLQFNPWQWSGQDKVLEAFLWQLGSLFGKEDIAKKTTKLASRWKAYASILKVGGVIAAPFQTLAAFLFSLATIGLVVSALIKAPGWILGLTVVCCLAFSVSFASKLMTAICTALSAWGISSEKPLEELRGEIATELRKLDKCVVVFVDDIDRLTDAEIKLLVQLVKVNAEFPNLVFFLLFQKNIVTRALQAMTSDDGEKYLRKIVQVEFAVPVASEKELQGMLTAGLDQIITREGVSVRWDDQRWPLLFLDTLWPYFRTLRDIKRFLGAFEFYFNMQLNQGTLEVNPIDLIAVETIRMFDHEAFLDMACSFFHRRQSILRSLFGQEEIAKHFQEDIDNIVAGHNRDDRQQARLKALLQALFPQALGDQSPNEWKRDLRLCDELSFDKYFQVTTDLAKPTAHEVRRFVQVSADRDQLVGLIRKTIVNNTTEDFLDFVFVTKEEIPVEQMETVATAFFDIGDELPDPKPSLFSVGLDMQCNRIIYHRLRGEDRRKATDMLWHAYNNTTGFIMPIHNLALEDKTVRARGEKTEFVIAEDRIDDFIRLVVNRIRDRAQDFSLLDHKQCGYVLYRWKEWAGLEEVKQWIGQVINDPNGMLKLLSHLVSVTIVNGVKRIPYLDGESVEQFIELQQLYERIATINSEALTETDRINVALLRKAIARKAEGKPYSQIKLKDFDF